MSKAWRERLYTKTFERQYHGLSSLDGRDRDGKESLVNDKMVHIVSDGGARPNPGPSGWRAIIGQNKKY
jgi:hypothetical protein